MIAAKNVERGNPLCSPCRSLGQHSTQTLTSAMKVTFHCVLRHIEPPRNLAEAELFGVAEKDDRT